MEEIVKYFKKVITLEEKDTPRLLQVSDVQKSEAQHTHPNLAWFQENNMRPRSKSAEGRAHCKAI